MPQSNSQTNPQSSYIGSIPKEGPKAIPENLEWSIAPSFVFDLVAIKQQGKLSGIQAIFVDNSANDQPLLITSSIINQTISVAVGYQGYFPLLVSDQVKVTCSSAGTGFSEIIFLNFPIACAVWPALVPAGSTTVVVTPNPLPTTDQTLAPLVTGGALTTADQGLDAIISGGALTTHTQHQTVTVADHSGTITAGGTQQTATTADATRNLYRLQNIDPSEDMWYRDDGAAAVIGGAGSFLLGAGGGFAQGNSQQAISVIATTTAHKFTLKTN